MAGVLLNNYPYPFIAREGWLFLALACGLSSVISFLYGAWSIPFWMITLFILQFFRDPGRVIPQLPDVVLSPADGRIAAVEKVLDPYANRTAIKISVFMSLLNVHSNRSPVDGRIEKVTYYPGQLLKGDLDKSSEKNERNALIIHAANDQLVTCVQIAGLFVRRILCYVKEGDVLTRGQRYGFIRFGSRVDLYLPLTAIPKVAVGDKVTATETILADL